MSRLFSLESLRLWLRWRGSSFLFTDVSLKTIFQMVQWRDKSCCDSVIRSSRFIIVHVSRISRMKCHNRSAAIFSTHKCLFLWHGASRLIFIARLLLLLVTTCNRRKSHKEIKRDENPSRPFYYSSKESTSLFASDDSSRNE